jgi:hypothetical protein
MSVSASTLLLPAPDTSWRVWKPRAARPEDALEHPAAFTDTSKPLVVGLPATACRTIGLVLPQSDPDVLDQMVMAQLEKRGIKAHEGTAKNFRAHQLGASGPHAIISVDVLAEPFPEQLTVNHASNYTSALRLVHLPEGHLSIIEEHGDLVLAAAYQGKLFHSHIFGQQPVTAGELAHEITVTRLALESLPAMPPVKGITLVGTWNRALIQALASATSLEVTTVAELPQSRDQDTGTWSLLLPAAVRESQDAAARRKKITRHGVLGAALLASLAFLGFAYLRHLEMRAKALAAEVGQSAPAALAVKKTAESWKSLSLALEPKNYPIMLMMDITSLMPPSGIVMRDFETKPDTLEIRGEARDATMAFTFLEDLKKHKNLGRFTWAMPQPKVEGKTATFVATGKLTP